MTIMIMAKMMIAPVTVAETAGISTPPSAPEVK